MQAEGSGSQGSGCLFSGGSLPAPHAGLHTAPHTPLRTALRRLAHAANQCARRGRPIRASRREDGAARGRDGAARGCFRPRPSVFPAALRARPLFPGFPVAVPSRGLLAYSTPRRAGGRGEQPVCPRLGDLSHQLARRDARGRVCDERGTGPNSFPSVGSGKSVGPSTPALARLQRRAPVREPSVWGDVVCRVTRGWGCRPAAGPEFVVEFVSQGGAQNCLLSPIGPVYPPQSVADRGEAPAGGRCEDSERMALRLTASQQTWCPG